MQPEPTTLAYLAGVIDSDGYVSVCRSFGVRSRVPYYGAQIGITGTRREPHDLAASIWGGKVLCYKPKNPKHRPQFQWQRCGRVAAQAIEALLPYLRIKREQAYLALDVECHTQAGRDDDPYPWLPAGYDPIPYLDGLYHDAKALNCRKPHGKQLALHLPRATPPRPITLQPDDVVYLGYDGTTYSSREEAPPDAIMMARVGKARAGRLLDGREWNEMPTTAREPGKEAA